MVLMPILPAVREYEVRSEGPRDLLECLLDRFELGREESVSKAVELHGFDRPPPEKAARAPGSLFTASPRRAEHHPSNLHVRP
jgi:hypothetical protein